MIKKILFPTDGSKNSARAIEYTREVAQKFDAEIVVLHCYESPLTAYTPNPYEGEDLLDDFLFDTCKVILKDAVQTLEKDDNAKVKGILEKGKPGPSIINIAEKEGCNLIIMGSRGLGPVKSMLLGSTSNYVIHHSKFPIMLVNWD